MTRHALYASVSIKTPMRSLSWHVIRSTTSIVSALFRGLIRAITVVLCAGSLLKSYDDFD